MAEIIVRLESDNGYTAYAFNCDALVTRTYDVFPAVMNWLPGVFSKPLDAFLFGLRHGPVQKMLKDKGLPELDKKAEDKNAETAKALAMIFLSSVAKASTDANGNVMPVDITRDDLAGAYTGLVRRVPEYDGLPHETVPAGQIEAPAEPAAIG